MMAPAVLRTDLINSKGSALERSKRQRAFGCGPADLPDSQGCDAKNDVFPAP